MANEDYRLAQKSDLERITHDVTQETVRTFHPTWYTEHWANFETSQGTRLTFRFERPGYIGTCIGSMEERHYFGTEQKESDSLGIALVKRDPKLKVHRTNSSSPIREISERMLNGKKVTDLQVVRGNKNTPDYVKVGVEGGAYGVMAFLPGTLIAVEYHGTEGDKVFGVEGKELGHRRLNLVASVVSGRDVTYTDQSQVRGEVFIIPDFTKAQPEPKGPKKLPYKKSK
ncbi:MAG: hypothetical protein AABX23_01620 [Nanoarchaeota archaeon]|mgnify:CR=1 FL=1